uniref:RING-type domain-containing protein n=1 Tax=Elaeophora elaphi TaxID=1147741 RepID=A0A158Q813_9BILA
MQQQNTQQFQGAVRLQNEIPFEELDEEEQWRIEHAKLHEKHRGHEQMHMEIFLILIVTLVVAQIALLCTLLGMWLIPVFICVQRYWWRFLITWIVYSMLSTVIWYRATRPQISGKTPSYVLGIVGYIFIMFTLLGLNHIFAIKARILMDAGLLLLFYGLYYGVLGRDFAHICTDRIASKIGYYTEEGLPRKNLEANVCAVCGNHLEIDDTETEYESTYRLSCGHLFHEFCIRGWCVIGKQQTCPYCKEKVDLKRMFKHPWQKPHLFYGQLLDWIRYLVAWQPLIVTFVKGNKKPSELAKPTVKPVAAAFASDDDDGSETTLSEVTSSTVRAKMQAKREHERALAEDPTIFDYDNVYDELQAKKNQKIAEIKTADKERKSKYAEQILEAHKKRLLAQQSREERKQQKEREAEAGQFDDKEKFVTSAYKKQLAEMENFRLQEAVDNRLNELTAVEKQKSGVWKGGFYRTLLDDIAGDSSIIKTEKGDMKLETISSVNLQQTIADSVEHAKKLSSLRKDSRSDDRFLELSTDKPIKKSIYSDDSDEESELNSTVSVDLKPALSHIGFRLFSKPQMKKPTKAEQIRRRFTPSPEHQTASSSGDEELSERREKRTERYERSREHKFGRQRQEKIAESHSEKRNPPRHHDKSSKHHSVEKKEHKKSEEKQKVGGEENRELRKRTVKEKTKAERLQTIRMILAHRNDSAKIEEIRQRYLERKKEKKYPVVLMHYWLNND